MEYSKRELDDMLKKHISLPKIEEEEFESKLIRKDNIITESKDSITNNDVLTIKNKKNLVTVPIISLTCWIKKYGNYLPEEIKIIKLEISGVLNKEYLLFKVPHPSGGEVLNGELKKDSDMEEGTPRKELIMFKNTDNIHVLDLNICNISVYKSGVRMIHKYRNGFIKTYSGKPNYLVATLTNNELFPYHIVKIKNEKVLIFKENNLDIDEFYKETADIEAIRILYPVINKYNNLSKIRKNSDVFSYFLNIQKNLRDYFHQIKIDNILIGMLTGRFPANKNLATHVGYQKNLVF